MLLDLELVGAGEDLPVEVPQVVTGRVGTVLGELDAEPLEGRPVRARREPLDDHLGAKLETREASERLGVEIDRGVRLGRTSEPSLIFDRGVGGHAQA